MYAKTTTVINSTGLHARPASVFVIEAKKYAADVTIRRVDDQSAPVNAKSMVRLLAAGIVQGTTVEIAAEGTDEVAAVDALIALLVDGFGEK